MCLRARREESLSFAGNTVFWPQKKFSRYSSNEIGLLCLFISGSSSFSVIHANVDFKIKSKERISFVAVVFFISKSPGSA